MGTARLCGKPLTEEGATLPSASCVLRHSGTEGARLLVFPLRGTHFPSFSTLRAQPDNENALLGGCLPCKAFLSGYGCPAPGSLSLCSCQQQPQFSLFTSCSQSQPNPFSLSLSATSTTEEGITISYQESVSLCLKKANAHGFVEAQEKTRVKEFLLTIPRKPWLAILHFDPALWGGGWGRGQKQS